MFANISNEQLVQIQEILARLDRGPLQSLSTNRRRAQRINLRTAMMAIVFHTTGPQEVKIFTRNISTSGVGFISRRPFKPEERVVIPFEVPGQTGKLVLAKLTFARYIPGGVYDAGAEFIECIPDPGGPDRIPEHWISGAPVRAKARV